MHKIERVNTVLKGGEVDRPPISLWYHFGIQHSSGERFARTTLEYFNRYDLDFLKAELVLTRPFFMSFRHTSRYNFK